MHMLNSLNYRDSRYWATALLFVLAITLTACGFQLKQSAAIPASFGPVKVTGVSNYSNLYKTIRNSLRQSDIEIIQDDSASHVLTLSQIRNERRSLSVDASGKVSEYELIKTLTFQVFDRNGNEVTESQTLSSNYSYTVSSDDVLGKSLEEEDISERMEQSLVDRMFRYIANRVK